MQEADRKSVWALAFAVAVVAVELLLILFAQFYQAADQKAQTEAYQWIWECVTSAAFWTAIFTGILTWSTFYLWRETRRLAKGADDQANKMQQSITQMARAADATALMARNLLRATRPLITMQGIYLERYDEEFERFECGDGSYVKTIHGTLVNQGKAKGFVKETWFEATLATVIGAPAQVATGDAIPGYHDIEPAQLHRPLWPFYYITLNDEFDRRELPFYVWGWIRYADVHGIVRRSGFAFEFFPVDDDPYSKGFFQPCERAYWYDVEEPAKET